MSGGEHVLPATSQSAYASRRSRRRNTIPSAISANPSNDVVMSESPVNGSWLVGTDGGVGFDFGLDVAPFVPPCTTGFGFGAFGVVGVVGVVGVSYWADAAERFCTFGG